MDKVIHFFSNVSVITSLILGITLWIIKIIVARMLVVSKLTASEKRRAITQVRNTLTIVFLLGLTAIWAKELQAFALSIVAVAVSIVIATKELILCFLGGILRTSSNSFEVGNRIEVNGVRGDVIDTNFLTTKILEIGPGTLTHQYTGRSITIPNATFLNQTVLNESYMEKFVLHVIKLPMPRSIDINKSKANLLKAANEVSDRYIEGARKHFSKLSRRESIESITVEPMVWVHFPNWQEVDLVVRVPAPPLHKGHVEQDIVHRFLEYQKKDKNK